MASNAGRQFFRTAQRFSRAGKNGRWLHSFQTMSSNSTSHYGSRLKNFLPVINSVKHNNQLLRNAQRLSAVAVNGSLPLVSQLLMVHADSASSGGTLDTSDLDDDEALSTRRPGYELAWTSAQITSVRIA